MQAIHFSSNFSSAPSQPHEIMDQEQQAPLRDGAAAPAATESAPTPAAEAQELRHGWWSQQLSEGPMMAHAMDAY